MLKKVCICLTAVAAVLSPRIGIAASPDTAVLINHLPQSANFYLVHNLMTHFGLRTTKISWKTFPNDTASLSSLTRFAADPSLFIANASLPPTVENIEALNNHLGKIILHVRDPRDALISWISYTDRHRHHSFTLGLVYPAPPAEYFGWTFEDKVNWQIDHFYSYCMDWLSQWESYLSANPELNVLVTHFEDAARSPAEFFKTIAAFYGDDPDQYDEASIYPLKKYQYHFSVEDIGSWKEKLTHEQQERVNAMLPAKVSQFFSWEA